MKDENLAMGRPSVYGFEKLVKGEMVVKKFKTSEECERIRRAALAHARRNGKKFRTTRKQGILYIQRTE